MVNSRWPIANSVLQPAAALRSALAIDVEDHFDSGSCGLGYHRGHQEGADDIGRA